ncbi:hypothetical protein EEJ42_40125 [Streptomyces botrytidirepellens]|uniref:Uncharacterized protein n=1 Tax=Streptomyces botrytidirepellens TaxID=2486417 RepID=A0A3M8TFP2_9ACTN|nr:hypothetical protein EEJ42_40125 [Streptomyces botrytidirepellens]
MAFRADEQGVFLGGPPIRYHKFSVTVPWRDIEALVLWTTKKFMEKRIRRIGLKLRPGVPHLPGPDEKISPGLTASVAPHIEYEVVRNNRVIAFWKVDHARLATAVQAFAPDVQLVAHPLYRLDERRGSGSPDAPDADIGLLDLF